MTNTAKDYTETKAYKQLCEDLATFNNPSFEEVSSMLADSMEKDLEAVVIVLNYMLGQPHIETTVSGENGQVTYEFNCDFERIQPEDLGSVRIKKA